MSEELIKHIAKTECIRLRDEGEGEEMTRQLYRDQVDTACRNFAPANDMAEEVREKIVSELAHEMPVGIGHARILDGDDEGPEWWMDRRGELDLQYWNRYREYMTGKLPNEDVVRELDRSTDLVMKRLGDPLQEGNWDRRGMVVGLVQSGKTGHYTGVINKAVDAGYKIIIVLTGFTNSLRRQTQIRIEEGVLGYTTDGQPVGVGNINNNVRQKCANFTTRNDDFNVGRVANFNYPIGGDMPLVFAVKKNTNALSHLIKWLKDFGNGQMENNIKFAQDEPLLVIDDESDVGSVNTNPAGKEETPEDDDGKPQQEFNPTTINRQIRQILSLANQSSYVAYTATPFANIMIDPRGPEDLFHEGIPIGEDLFPRSFVIAMEAPTDHVGPAMLFGTDANSDPGLPICRDVTDTDGWMPRRCDDPSCPCRDLGRGTRKNHIPKYQGQPKVPPSLRKAILCFILVCAARRARGDVKEHNSMLIHVTRFALVQVEVERQVIEVLDPVRTALEAGTGTEALYRELEDLWGTEQADFESETKKPLLQQMQKVGENGRIGIWNKALNDAGFTAGTPIEIDYNGDTKAPFVCIKPAARSKRKVSRCINHDRELPVIDLKHTKALPMADIFAHTDCVQVTIEPNLVTVQFPAEGGDPESFLATTREIRRKEGPIFDNPEHQWKDIKPHIRRATSKIITKVVQGGTGELEYDTDPNGMSVIAVGGNKLARGLTLEGLSVSYFVRSSTMYDTLMQMGRWFGYRPGYLDLCRLFTTPVLRGWFRDIASSTEELRQEFNVMADEGKKPTQYGLKVRSHPSLLVTSRLKSKGAITLRMSFAGQAPQKTDFDISPATIRHNWSAAESLWRKITAHPNSEKVEQVSGVKIHWKKVPAGPVCDFLNAYRDCETTRNHKSKALSEYIEKQNALGSLTEWTVGFSNGSQQETVEIDGVPLKMNKRGWEDPELKTELKSKNHFRTGATASGDDQLTGLDPTILDEAGRLHRNAWEKGGEKGNAPDPDKPGALHTRRVRPSTHGMLIIYPISPADIQDTDDPITGFMLSLPFVSEENDTHVEYVIPPSTQQLDLFDTPYNDLQ